MYQVGQAVIDNTDPNRLYVYDNKQGNWIGGLLSSVNTVLRKDDVNFRPVTEAEILAEAVKHGWERRQGTYYSATFVKIIKTNNGKWVLGRHMMSLPVEKTLKQFGQECITAHQLITALNLAK